MPDSDRFSYFYSSSSSTAITLSALLSTFLSKAVLATIVAPLNFIENRFQVMSQMKRNGLIKQNYRSYSDCVTTAVRQENGIKTLWKGNFSKILLGWMGIIFALTAGDYGKRQFSRIYKSTAPQGGVIYLKYFGNIAGMFSSLGSIIMTYPLQYAYVRLLTDKQSAQKTQPKQFRNIRHLLFKTLAEDGLRGLYRGVFTSFGAIALYRVSYFGLYDMWNGLRQKTSSLFHTFFVSYMITLTASAIAYPANTIRKRMMMRSLEAEKYRWSGDCLSYILKNQGFSALYRGFPMSLITAISSSILLITYDKFKTQLRTDHQ